MAIHRISPHILKAKALVRYDEEVEIPEWGGTVLIRRMTEAEEGRYADWLRETGTENASAKLIVSCLVDERGKPMFTRDDAEWLGEMPAPPIRRITNAISRLHGWDETAQEASLPNTFTPAPPAIEDEDQRILDVLRDTAPKLLTIPEIQSGSGVGRRSVMDRVTQLIANGLACRPKGPNKGTTITPAGIGVLEQTKYKRPKTKNQS